MFLLECFMCFLNVSYTHTRPYYVPIYINTIYNYKLNIYDPTTIVSLKTTFLIFLEHSKNRNFIHYRRKMNEVDFLVPMSTVIHFLFQQARRVKKRTSLRSLRLMKFIISCKRPPPRSALSGSKPSRWPPGLGSEDTPAAHPHSPEGMPWISSVQDLFISGDRAKKEPRGGKFSSRGF